MKVTLEILNGPNKGKTQEIENGSVVLMGRSSDCQVVSNDSHVSRYHCMLENAGEVVRVRDTGSLNGTYHNGDLVDKRPKGMDRDAALNRKFNTQELHDGSIIDLGSEKYLSVKVHITSDGGSKQKMCPVCHTWYSGSVCPNCAAKKKPAASLGPGEFVPGYKKIKELGHGGMGVVYLVTETATGRQCALKTILPQHGTDSHTLEGFAREASWIGQLNHQYVAKQTVADAYRGTLYIIMDYYKDGTLQDMMDTSYKSPTRYRDAKRFGVMLLKGLDYLHNVSVTVNVGGAQRTFNGIVHRDMKPGNVFIEKRSGETILRIADFGLAKAFDSAGMDTFTATGSFAGTLAFMPRQQIVNFKYAKPEVDIWAVAAIMYMYATGRPPKPFTKSKDAFSVVLTEKCIPAKTADPSMPSALASLLDKALDDSGSKLYYQTARAFLSDLEALNV